MRTAAELVRKGDVVWDVGANVGLFSFAAAFLAGPGGQVLAIEPDCWLVQLLRRSAAQRPAGVAPITVLPAAISDRVGVTSFEIAARARASNSLPGFGLSQKGGVREVQTVVSLSLDSLLEYFPAPTVLKIDVEGAELLVMSGARRVLEQARPRIMCEVDPKNAQCAADLLRAYGYGLWNAEQHSRIEQATAAYNTIAVPGPAAHPALMGREGARSGYEVGSKSQ
jgi:FkbM family methyltransferase